MTGSDSARIAEAVLPLFRAAMGGVEIRQGGDGVIGLYLQDTLFGLIQDGVALFRVDARTRADYDAAEADDLEAEPDGGVDPFEPPGGATLAATSFRRLPPAVLDDEELLADWGRKAWEAGKRARAGTQS
ncbi:TfoX/Sxy family protein [Rhodospira trueperi]|uniref:DNA transformation protein n=1 Tax=Rhodospira trueperi TaxID=69960 RepID=A0A1G7DYH5_9PROT|nr:TfoX/Sxy family protein [Rhodospira trueperi]SDE56135.1 DNA transformation protein [Rhodospira trueperi]